MDLPFLPYSPERDVYLLLGVDPGADRAAVADACRRLARTFHPDRNGSARATEEMRVVNAVRAMLVDARARAEYDHARRAFLARPGLEPVRPRRVLVPANRPMPRSAAWEQAARATLRAMLVGLATLAAERCVECEEPIATEHHFCAWCGAPRRRAKTAAAGAALTG